MLQPHPQRADRVLVRVPERVYPAATLEYPLSLVRLAGLLISADCLCNYFTRFGNLLNDDAPGVADVRAEKLLPQGDQAHTGRA